jgi:dihydrofolate synthase/folylpolyglutamate synthase
VSSDKDVAGIASPLIPAFDAVIATAYRQERSMSPGALAAVLHEVIGGSAQRCEVEEAEEVEAALAAARRRAGPGGSIVAAGSLFLVGEVRVAVLGGEVDPIRLADPSGAPKG